jgi:hypothetical protein
LKLSCFLAHFKEKVASHQNEGFETPVDAAKEFACGSVATVTDLGEALGVDLEASEKEIGAAAEINVLLNLHGDLLVVERRGVFDNAATESDVIGQQGDATTRRGFLGCA